MKIREWLLATALLVVTSSPNFANSGVISKSEAGNNIGKHATVCGKVASTKYAERTKGQPTFLNLDKPYPHQNFTVVIWGDKRDAFGSPEVAYKGQSVCVTGEITSFKGKPEIIANEPSQITITH